MAAAGDIAVVGEALIDLVDPGDDTPAIAHAGGSPYNVAIGLARLDRPVRFVGRFSTDAFGGVLRRHAERSRVDLSSAVTDPRPSTIALVELHDGIASYTFSVDGTADFAWTTADITAAVGEPAVLHVGSLASWLPPGHAAVEHVAAQRRAAGALVSYDPNVRPQLQPDVVEARTRVEAMLPHAHVVKASSDDLIWLYGDDGANDDAVVVQRWLELGPELVVVTRGGEGAMAYRRAGAPLARPVVPAPVVDTVGAGDSFMSGLLDALSERGAASPAGVAAAAADDALLAAVLDHAALVAAITCSRAGANPPRRSELTEPPVTQPQGSNS